MKSNRLFVSMFASLGIIASLSAPALAAAVGEPAPAFSVTDNAGKARTLDDFKGKYLVLEWHNQGCPYVKKHYNTGNMQKLQSWAKEKGVAWLTVISSAKGSQGFVTPQQENQYLK